MTRPYPGMVEYLRTDRWRLPEPIGVCATAPIFGDYTSGAYRPVEAPANCEGCGAPRSGMFPKPCEYCGRKL